MVRAFASLFVILAATAAAQQQPTAASAPAPARAIIEKDWVLMNWALKYYDADRDVLLEPGEAQAAAEAFRRIADGDGDGRVTPQEFRDARAFILARY